MKPVGYIYKIENLRNGKIYIGATQRSIYQRWIFHKSTSAKSVLNKEIKKYGEHNFKLSLVKTCFSVEQLKYSEKFFISICNSNNRELGYNKTDGGDNIRSVKQGGYVHAFVTADTKEKLVKLAKDQNRSESYVAGQILDKALTPTTKAK